ncbi:histidine phosphatase family protein [Bombilactobacillus thymidiniphilus]|uniref:Histidine phosphatase family protein n=1 Tax=Bombilactobacillus thymidiniphilus TaxID=2923363 RepID=A0ABY4PE56_9LACO|nr:histidine phosphatase family protein [Bombilactobacillus thymidiniphilus]UQS84073.1 histidine phosphatase family protein [Bombilactobacillus thymidiniphilus]
MRKFKLSKIILLALLLGGSGSIALGTQNVSATSKKVILYVVRHGETTANVMHLAQGWSDFPLTPNGIQGAKYLGAGLKKAKFQSAYAGDLTRQEKTARGTLDASNNGKVKVHVDQRLREGNFGSYEARPDSAKNIPDIVKYFGYKDSNDFTKQEGKHFPSKYQDGYYELDKKNTLHTDLAKSDRAESSNQVKQRMQNVMNYIVKHQKNNSNVLVVSSGMAIDQFLEKENIPQYKGDSLGNDSVTKLVYKNGKYHVQGKIGSLKYFNQGKKDLNK